MKNVTWIYAESLPKKKYYHVFQSIRKVSKVYLVEKGRNRRTRSSYVTVPDVINPWYEL
jgi:hypothetical protein